MRNDEFDAAYRATAQQLTNFAFRRIARDEVDDVVAETYRIAFEKRHKVDSGEILPWLYRIATNVISNQRRKLAKLPLSLDFLNLEPVAPTPSFIADTDEALAKAWAQLREAERAIIALNVFEELQPREIGVAMGISANAASIRLFRAKTQLKELLAEERKRVDETSK